MLRKDKYPTIETAGVSSCQFLHGGEDIDAIEKQKSKGKGYKALRKEIKAKKTLIKQSKKEIDASKNTIFQEEQHLKAMRKKWNADPSSVKNFSKKTDKAKKIT